MSQPINTPTLPRTHKDIIHQLLIDCGIDPLELSEAANGVVTAGIPPLKVDPLYLITKKLYPRMAKQRALYGVSYDAMGGKNIESLRFQPL